MVTIFKVREQDFEYSKLFEVAVIFKAYVVSAEFGLIDI